MKRSMTPPTSSASVGISGLTFCGLKVRFDVTFPTRFMLSTWSGDQLSMLSDLTFEMWVPILRWMAAQLMQRKIPSCYCYQKSAQDRSDGYSHSNSTMLVQMSAFKFQKEPCLFRLAHLGSSSRNRRTCRFQTLSTNPATCAHCEPAASY
jgi:hypothetical protein